MRTPSLLDAPGMAGHPRMELLIGDACLRVLSDAVYRELNKPVLGSAWRGWLSDSRAGM